jgi:hypothetical protein
MKLNRHQGGRLVDITRHLQGLTACQERKKRRDADSVNTSTGMEKSVLCSAPPNGCRNTQHPTWNII